jgi:hypothetical protein
MSFFGMGGRPQISSEQKIAQAEAEIDMVSDMYSRYVVPCNAFWLSWEEYAIRAVINFAIHTSFRRSYLVVFCYSNYSIPPRHRSIFYRKLELDA